MEAVSWDKSVGAGSGVTGAGVWIGGFSGGVGAVGTSDALVQVGFGWVLGV